MSSCLSTIYIDEAHEVNGYGFITPCFVMRLSHKLYNYSGVDGFDGLIYYSDNMRPLKGLIESNKVCSIT